MPSCRDRRVLQPDSRGIPIRTGEGGIHYNLRREGHDIYMSTRVV
jgi:hypothetical protein